MKFAARMEQLRASGIRRMFELAAAMKSPINLSLGQADFDVPDAVKKAASEAIESGKNRYSITAGIPEFQKAIRHALEREGCAAESVMAVAGASGGLILALFALAGPGDEVLIADPYFVSYPNMIEMVGATTRLVDTYPAFKLTPERLEKAITPKTRILIFNSPVNPTGIAYTADEIRALAAVTRKAGVTVISDEVYDLFCYDFPHECWLKHDPEALLVRSFSKTWGMPGWRVGYVAGPATLLEQMKVLQQFTFVCVPTPLQHACVIALETSVEHHRKAYAAKRDRVYAALKTRFDVEKPEGAFYIYPAYPNGDAVGFMKRCIEREILVVPGSAFSARDTHFRVSYALGDAELERGIDALLSIS